MGEIWAVILAAGESSRMNTNKLLLPFKGKSIIRTVIGLVMESDVDNYILVTGAYREALMDEIAGMPINECHNPDHKQGMLSSVRCGIAQLPDKAVAALVFLGDQPMISSETVNLVIREYHQSENGIILPVSNGRRGHPILIDRKYFSIIGELDPSTGLRGLILKYPHDIAEIEVNMPGILRDIDTLQDYMNETKLN